VRPAFSSIFNSEQLLVGRLPIALPGMPPPLRLGLAGGPLLVALCLSQIGRVGPLIWYLTPGADLVLREIGIVLFLACVGFAVRSSHFGVWHNGNGPARRIPQLAWRVNRCAGQATERLAARALFELGH
jgi:Predicted Permease Membrane Region